MHKEEPKRYYDFKSLLHTKSPLPTEVRQGILRESTEEDIKKAIITSAVNALVMVGDNQFYKGLIKKEQIANENDIQHIIDQLKTIPTINAVLDNVNALMNTVPKSAAIYTTLFDFELILIRQKNEGLT